MGLEVRCPVLSGQPLTWARPVVGRLILNGRKNRVSLVGPIGGATRPDANGMSVEGVFIVGEFVHRINEKIG